ncbi:MAG: M20 metallopeptidase family protein [Thermoanaerobacteraceae bacterium]
MDILSEVQKVEQEIIELRRKIHMYPELGFEENRTSELVIKNLSDLGIEVKRGAKTGVIGFLKGNGQKTIALRADMDALPIQEENDLPYASLIPGRMHACGHDVHTAILLGTAKILSKNKDLLKGNIKFIFQPAEETTGGALPMIEEGVLKEPKVDAIIGLHVDPDLEVGQIGITYGKAYASSDMFDIIVKGKSGHGAQPHKTVDPIVISAQIINSLQTIASRYMDPLLPIVISIGSIEGGYARNVIPSKVKLSGIIRLLEEDKRDEIALKIEKIAVNIAESFGGEIEFKRIKGYPCLINDRGITDFVKTSLSKAPAIKSVIEVPPTMGVEDFAYYLKYVPGCFYKLGCGNSKMGINKPIHNNMFNVDENCIQIGMISQVLLAFKFLNDTSANKPIGYERQLKNIFNYSDSL